MALIEFNTVLCRLYKDSYFRTCFFQNPDHVLNTYHLTESETSTLKALDPSQIEKFGLTLKNKLKNRVMPSFEPLFVHDPELMTLIFERAYDLLQHSPDDSTTDYCIKFGRFCEAYISGLDLPGYYIDAIRYLNQQLQHDFRSLYPQFEYSEPTLDTIFQIFPGVMPTAYQYDIAPLVESMRKKTSFMVPNKETFYALSYNDGVYAPIQIGKGLYNFLLGCNGVSPTKDILRSLGLSSSNALSEALTHLIPNILKYNLIYPVPKDDPNDVTLQPIH